MSKLIDKIVQKITVEYNRLSIVRDPDGFLAMDAVRNLIYHQHGIEIISGSNLNLRIHFELEYKNNKEKRYIYLCQSPDTLLADMRQEAYVKDFSISTLFPLFADKSLLNNLDYEVIERLYDQVAMKRISMTEGRFLIETIKREQEEKKRQSGDYILSQLHDTIIDWNSMLETISSISSIIAKAVKAGCYEVIDEEIANINQSFQAWIDKHYFAAQNSNPLLKAKCVNKILPYLTNNFGKDDKVALLVVDGLAYWQYTILQQLLTKQGISAKNDSILSWLPSITMLSRQAIFRGENPMQDYKQNPDNEQKLWRGFWQKEGFAYHQIQYLSDKDEFAVNEEVRRLAYVTVEMDEKMHSSSDYKDLFSLTENWCPRIINKIATLKEMGFTIFLTADHGSVLSHGWRTLTPLEKVYLYKDGSRGKRHLIYNNKEEQERFYVENKDEIRLLCHDNWISVRDASCIDREGETMITHGGSHFMEVVIPWVTI